MKIPHSEFPTDFQVLSVRSGIAVSYTHLAMLCTLLVGCGSKSDDSNGDYKPFVEVQGVSDDTILVGNTAATTGAYATVGVPFNAGMEAAFKACLLYTSRCV